MDRMKTFFIYFLIIVVFYVVSDAISYMLLKSTYISRDYQIEFDNPQVTISEMKSTKLNGYLKGKINNNTGEVITGKALKFDYYSKNGVLVGTKYSKVSNVLAGETLDFESRFNFNDVDSVKVSIVDALEMDESKFDFSLDDWSKDDIDLFILLGAIILVFT